MSRKINRPVGPPEESNAANIKATPDQVKPEENAARVQAIETAEPDITVFRPDRAGIRKVLGDLEADVMEFVWHHSNPAARPGLTVREVYEAFRLERVIAYTTVMSTMARLARKRLLQAHKKDGAYLYTPSLSKDEFIDNFVARILENLLVSFSPAAETHLQRLMTSDGTQTQKIEKLKAQLNTLRISQSYRAGHKPPEDIDSEDSQ